MVNKYEVIETNITTVVRTWVIEAENEMEAYNIAQTKQPDKEITTNEEGLFDVKKSK